MLRDNAENDKDATPPPSPLAYKLLTWRRAMKVGYLEMMNTPWEVIYRDMEMLALENEFRAKPKPVQK